MTKEEFDKKREKLRKQSAVFLYKDAPGSQEFQDREYGRLSKAIQDLEKQWKNEQQQLRRGNLPEKNRRSQVERNDKMDASKNESHSPYTFRDLLTETLDRAATEAKIKSYEEQIAKLSEFFDNLDEKYYHKDKVDIKKKELRDKIEELKSKIRNIKE